MSYLNNTCFIKYLLRQYYIGKMTFYKILLTMISSPEGADCGDEDIEMMCGHIMGDKLRMRSLTKVFRGGDKIGS